MATYTDINDTRSSLSVPITQTDIEAAEMALMADAESAFNTIANSSPSYSNFDSNPAYLAYGDGTQIWAEGTVSSSGSTYTGTGSLDVTHPNGFHLSADGTINLNVDTGSFSAKFSELSLENDFYDITYKGAVGITSDGYLTGTVSSMQFTRTTADPAVWEAIIFTGKTTLDTYGNLTGTITGVVVGYYDVDYSTPSVDDDHTVVWNATGKATGLKVSASSLEGMTSYDSLFAMNLSGNDKLTGTAGDDYIDAGAGNDTVDGLAGDDEIYGGAGNDKLTDTLGNNILDGGDGNNAIIAGSGDDTIYANSGNDKINAGDGWNLVDAGDGNNSITVGSGNDTIYTGSGNDKINVGDGMNDVFAGAGNDKITAGSGDDWIVGGAGADKVSGGSGSDYFVFDNVADGGFDTISDFSAADDMLIFDAAVFTALSGGVAADNLYFGAAAQDADDYLVFNASGGKLYYDADGNGSGALIQIAVLKGGLSGLSEANFDVLV